MPFLGNPCAECERRWRELAAATTAHLELLKQRELIVSPDSEGLKTIDSQIETAAVRSDTARIAVKAHLAADHPEEGEIRQHPSQTWKRSGAGGAASKSMWDPLKWS